MSRIEFDGQQSSIFHRRIQTLSFYLLIIIFMFAPLIRGANRPIPLLVLELLCVVLLITGYYSWSLNRIGKAGVIWLVSFISIPLIYLVPLPLSIWEMLPGRESYAEMLRLIDKNASFHTLSLYGRQTAVSWLAMIIPVVIFVHVMHLSTQRLTKLVYLLFAIGVFQALVGMLQYAQGAESPLRFGMEGHVQSAIGTYANRNHLAGLLEMMIPMALLISYLYVVTQASDRRSQWQLTHLFNARFLMLFSVLIILLLGLIFTRSRTGIALTMLGIIVVMVIATRLLGKSMINKTAFFLSSIVLLLAAELGLIPILERFAIHDPLTDGRWDIFAAVWEGIKESFPVGFGPGTFPYVFPYFQPMNIQNFVNYAHNDYLEWIFEQGVFALLLILSAVYFVFSRWWVLLRGVGNSQFELLQIGAGVGIMLLLLHGWVDFNLHIPANAIFFAFLCGLFFRKETNN